MPSTIFLNRQRSRLARHAGLWWLALALALAPALGRMHQVLHVPLSLSAAQAATADSEGHAAPAAMHGTGQALDGPHGLFASHADVDCQMLDQQLLGGVLLATAHAAPQVYAPPDTQPAPPTTARWGARRLWACWARAPPAQA